MSEAGLLFITTPNADDKAISRLLLHLRNWQYGEEGDWDNFHVVTSRDLDRLKTSIDNDDVKPALPPYSSEGVPNEWQNATLDEVEAFMLDVARTYYDTGDADVNTQVPIILDEKGLVDGTCIICERKYHEKAETRSDTFNKVRMPWEYINEMWSNLDISNMDFEDYCDDDQGEGENGWWGFKDGEHGACNELDEESKTLRADAIKKLEEEGKA